ncbi:hypothetical protein LTR78_010321 [Recurvomyces mirabilis]|uniref:Uncharacterized protein n=1 Tax=Recurvomyces mirabilis TaxID=574656 RepID=A0AAE0WG94_9PEZI|nr:hypothetical protein LTR78_010321 [Recurvomyces mirabilis]KAK5149865.1 hypothetical protein LTS14_010580 [Recurvomyces mirabilis]
MPEDKHTIAVLRHALANIHNWLGHFEEADQITDEQLTEASTDSGRAYIGPKLHILILREKVEPYRLCSRPVIGSALQTTDQKVNSLLGLIDKACAMGFNDVGAHDPLLWHTIWKDFLVALRKEEPLVEGSKLRSLTKVLTRIHAFLTSREDRVHHGWTDRDGTISAYNNILTMLNIDQSTLFEEIVRAKATQCNLEATFLQRSGHFAKAEALHQKAAHYLGSCGEDDDLWSVIHYNTMLAIARQDGRLKEAYQYGSDHWITIQRGESRHGAIQVRLQQDAADHESYIEASRRRRNGEVGDDEWWVDHAAQLERSEALYGPLPTPTPSRSMATISEVEDQNPRWVDWLLIPLRATFR